MNKTFSLYRLQQLDTQRLNRVKRIKQIDTILASDKAVLKCQHKIDLALKQHHANEASLDELHQKVEEKSLKYKLTQSKLFGGKISVTRELQDLQAESEALTRAIQKLEEEQLTVIHQLEESQSVLDQARAAMTELLSQRATDHSKMLAEREKMMAELPKLSTQREVVLKQIPAELIDEYSRLFKAKAGLAVVEVFEDSCKACGCELSPTDLQQAAKPDVITKCKGCGRILLKLKEKSSGSGRSKAIQ